jgi:hypothetical protein
VFIKNLAQTVQACYLVYPPVYQLHTSQPPMFEFSKTNHYYVDETGHIQNDSQIFMLGCVKTDTPNEIDQLLGDRLSNMKQEIYYEPLLQDLEKHGFHAVANHPDVRADLFKILPILNFRAYFVLLVKKGFYYEELTREKQMHEIYQLMVRKLIQDRLINNSDINIFYFEELKIKKKSQDSVLSELFTQMNISNATYKIVSKSGSANLALVDYINYVFFRLLNDPSIIDKRMEQNFEIMKQKIGLIHCLNNDSFMTRKNKIELPKLLNLLAG